VGVYVNDLIIFGSDGDDIELFKLEMKRKFNMSILGLLSYYLGTKVKPDSSGIMSCQSSYAAKIIDMADMTNYNSSDTPMECRLKLSKKNEGDPLNPVEYIGSLRCITHTRPDLAFAVGVVSRYMEAPGKGH
jgi:hypothetical protein